MAASRKGDRQHKVTNRDPEESGLRGAACRTADPIPRRGSRLNRRRWEQVRAPPISSLRQTSVLSSANCRYMSRGIASIACSIISMYVTGEGLTTPAEDGLINSSTFPLLNLQVTTTIGGADAKVNYASEAPGIISGVAFI